MRGARAPETGLRPQCPSAPPSGVLVVLDERVGRVVVDGLEILRFHQVRGDALVAVEPGRNVAHHILDELRVVIRAFGHVLLVGALENSVQLARGLALGDLDELLDPHVAAQLGGDGHVRALEVVRQAHVHVEAGDSVLLARGSILDPHRVADVLDAHAVDGQFARVEARLHVLDLGDGGARELGGGERRSHDAKAYRKRSEIRSCIVSGAAVPRNTSYWVRPLAERRRCCGCAAHQRSTLALRPAASSPAAARHPSREPCSMKRSGIPSCSSGTCRPSAARSSPTAEPAPPCVAFSSRVTSARCRAASVTISSASSGLTKRMLTSVASRASAIGWAGVTSAPNASSASPLVPSRRSCALPTGSALSSAVPGAPGPAPRG